MFHNISNPKWFGNWSRLEDDYLGNGGTDIADNFTFSKREKTGGLFGSIISLATAFPACDPETGHATGAWKVACESIDLDEVPLSDIADMISGFDCETITDFRLFNTGAFDNTPWQRVLYQDIEKGRELDARAKLQLFGGNIASPDLDRKIIRLPECIVKLQAGSAPTEAARVQQESRDMASGSHALGAARPAFGTPAMNRPIDSNLE